VKSSTDHSSAVERPAGERSAPGASALAATLRITEIFYSLQGETSRVGLPTVFVRLTGCPLRCGYCDTAYAFHGGETKSVEQILGEVASHRARYVTVTGGEPLAQTESLDLIRRLCDEKFEVLIETSGSIDIEPVDRRAKIILDIKCPGSGESEKNRWANLDHLKSVDEIKFVIADRADYEWSRKVMEERNLQRWTILLSPVWGEMDMKSLAEWMLADRLPARFQTQLHKHIWGAEARGV
jgi:7-carboxy-7-deazaguanine synthase